MAREIIFNFKNKQTNEQNIEGKWHQYYLF